MTNKKIPKSVREIIDIFIRYNFTPLTYKMISEVLKVDTNAIVQRIKRNENYFEISKIRPFKIRLKPTIEEVYFYRDKNQCQICRKTFSNENLLLRFKDPHMKEKYNWDNGFTCCQECKDKEITKKTKKRRTPKNKIQKTDAWEYKEIYIKKIFHPSSLGFPQINYGSSGQLIWGSPIENNYSPSSEGDYDYYEFDELNGNGWFHLINDNDEISSKTIKEILDYFGADEWELISIEKITENNEPSMLNYIQGGSSLLREEKYHCIFKRKKKGD